MRIELYSQENISKYYLGVETVLDILGIGSQQPVLLTDMSDLGDFIEIADDGAVAELSRMVGRRLDMNSKIWEVAKWIEGA